MSTTVLDTDVFPTNADMLRLFEKSNGANDTATNLQKSILVEFPKSPAASCEPLSILTKVKRVNDKHKKFRKNKKSEQDEKFLSMVFEFPLKKDISDSDNLTIDNTEIRENIKIIQEKTIQIVKENRQLKRNAETSEKINENLSFQAANSERKLSLLQNLLEITLEKYSRAIEYKKTSYALEEDVTQWENKYDDLSKQFDSTAKELSELKQKINSQCTRNLNKKIKRRDEAIEREKENVKEKIIELRERNCELDGMKNKNESLVKEVENLKREKRNMYSKILRAKQKQSSNDSMYDLSENIFLEIQSLKSEIEQKNARINMLIDTNNFLTDGVIDTYYEGKYKNEVRQTIMTLVTECGVSQSKVNKVMEVVVKNLTGMTLSRLPSTGVKSRLVLEAKMVANRQIAEAMLNDNASFTLHQDGTSKHHHHYQSYQITGADGSTMSIGMHEVSRGNADTIFQTFTTILSDLAETIKNTDKRHNMGKIISNIIATMSDQAATNHVFNEKLQKFREDFLPIAYDNWEQMDLSSKEELGKLFAFFCKMHIFVNMANEVDSSLSQLEKAIIAEGRNPHAFSSKSESGTVRLIRTVSKDLTEGGCERSGVGGHFSTYLRNKEVKNHLETFRGHRFNHLFHAAATTYYHLDDIRDFLDSFSDHNELTLSVMFDVREPLYVACVRALGLIDKVITGPLWRVIEAAPNCLSLNTHLLQLKIALENWSKDAAPFLEGECVFDEMVAPITRDCVYDALFTPTDDPVIETYTQMALEVSFGAMLIILERQAKDQLPGGKYWHLDQTTTEHLANVPTTNTVSERDFAQLDILMKAKPAAAACTYESIILWTNNKTSKWLDSLEDDVRADILDQARTNAPCLRKKIQERQFKLFQAKVQVLKEKQEKKEKKAEKAYINKVMLTKELEDLGGLWMTSDDMMNFKQKCLSSCDKIDTVRYNKAVVTQILFRKNVLNCKGPRQIFQTTQIKGKHLTISDLEENLKQIMVLNADFEEGNAIEKKLTYKDPDQVKSSVVSLKENLFSKIETGRKKIIVQQQKDLLPTFLENPENMVGKNIKHKLKDPETGVVEWSKGKVVEIFKPHQNPTKVEYNICYDEYPDELWHFNIIKDMQNGDLILC